jgi:hypothetical protein
MRQRRRLAMYPTPRPPPEWFYQKILQKYEGQFRRKIPQWVQTLGNERVRGLVGVAMRLNWKLPPQILVASESVSDSEGLWAQRQTLLDFETERKNRGRFEPRDLQNLPIDPAVAAAMSYMKKGKKKWAK